MKTSRKSLENQRRLRESCGMTALLETDRGILFVQEHEEETVIYDVDVPKLNAM